MHDVKNVARIKVQRFIRRHSKKLATILSCTNDKNAIKLLCILFKKSHSDFELI